MPSKAQKKQNIFFGATCHVVQGRWFKKARIERIKEIIDISTKNLKDELYSAFGCEAESDDEP